jgi:hypothetical protein
MTQRRPAGSAREREEPRAGLRTRAELDRLHAGRLSDTTWVYPGHGSDTTLGAERPHLVQWRERGW